MSGDIQIPLPVNERVLTYAPHSPEREAVKAALAEMAATEIEIPLIIGGKEVRTGRTAKVILPHRHGHVVATYHKAGAAEVEQAIAAAAAGWREWTSWAWEDRASVFLRAAELLAHPWRQTLNAATMLGQSKTVHQAEIDSACELIDFYRFNTHFAERLYEDQPHSRPGIWNRMEYRPLEGFVYAVTPFNFTSIGGNLPGAPALMGNAVVWKPSSTSVYSGYYIQRLLEAAGLPPGVLNFVPGDSTAITERVLADPAFAGLHFTGSTDVFQSLWRTIGERIATYRTYPRIVGETGGKDFLIAHPSADIPSLRTAILRASFEYQGQKCSALSRVYVPASLWKQMKDDLLDQVEQITMGDIADFRNFMGAVISRSAYDKITGYIERARKSDDAEILAGGAADASEGYFIRPTVIEAKRPDFVTMCDEIFGPVVTIYVYRDDRWSETLDVLDATSPYGLTGAVFADDRRAVREAMDRLRFAAGNFYVNDKPTGAVVGQQPFGGSRASGTNDKAGSLLNLTRWVSARVIKENFTPPVSYRYTFMKES